MSSNWSNCCKNLTCTHICMSISLARYSFSLLVCAAQCNARGYALLESNDFRCLRNFFLYSPILMKFLQSFDIICLQVYFKQQHYTLRNKWASGMQSYNAIVSEGGVASNKFWWHYIYITNSNLRTKICVPRYYSYRDICQKHVFFPRYVWFFAYCGRMGRGIKKKKTNFYWLTKYVVDTD